MYKNLILILFVVTGIRAQTVVDKAYIDSVSYSYYLNGEWGRLIESAKLAKQNNIDFKYLQQRLGYAYYMLGDNYRTIKHYSNALRFDNTDPVSHTYLYYAARNTGDLDMASFHASKLDALTRKNLNIKGFKLIDALDVEYNYKINNSDVRSNPQYLRAGLNSKITDRLGLYQSVSDYKQINDLTTNINQFEYYALATYSLFSRTTVRLGYHFLATDVVDADYDFAETLYGNVICGSISQRVSRFDFGLSANVIVGDTAQTQLGFTIGTLLPLQFSPYLKSSIYTIKQDGVNRLVFSQSAGFLPFKKLWLESEITFGNLNNFVDNNGLYVYNSIDPTRFRVGATAYWYVLPRLTAFGNYTFDQKQIIESQTFYYQHSLSGGLIWKF